MSLFLAAVFLWVASGCLALGLSGKPKLAAVAGGAGGVLGGCVGLVPAFAVVAGRSLAPFRLAWWVPYGELHLAVDPLAAVFLVVVFGLGAVVSAYAAVYFLGPDRSGHTGWPFFLLHLLLASMAVVVAARNGMLFLTAWEIMAVVSFFLVTLEHERPAVRAAGWTYLVVTHAGTAFLLAFFAVLAQRAGSLDFDRLALLGVLPPVTASTVLVLGLIGFGTKAGIVPLHIWLPEAHPAAPSPVSALMSGAMIKVGIYGLLRSLTFIEAPPLWWGPVLIAVGLSSGVGGVLLALAQHDLKRLLAYHSVENIGIICLGIGVGLWGTQHGLHVVAALGFSGALLHVVNHGLFKSLLFLGAGAVTHATGERQMDRLGGLLRHMPVTGVTFLIASAAIVGLPPLNGFASEFLIFLGALVGSLEARGAEAVPMVAVIVGLGLIGGLAAACFAKAFGAVFLGHARSRFPSPRSDVSAVLLAPMVTLAALCVGVGLAAAWAVALVVPATAQLSGQSTEATQAALVGGSAVLGRLVPLTAVAVALTVALVALRWALLRGRRVGEGATWGCGYESPTPRMQYTAASFAQPLLLAFARVVRQVRSAPPLGGYYPRLSTLTTESPDPVEHDVARPFLGWVDRAASRVQRLQHGRVHLYLLYLLVTLVVLMVWRLGGV